MYFDIFAGTDIRNFKSGQSGGLPYMSDHLQFLALSHSVHYSLHQILKGTYITMMTGTLCKIKDRWKKPKGMFTAAVLCF